MMHGSSALAIVLVACGSPDPNWDDGAEAPHCGVFASYSGPSDVSADAILPWRIFPFDPSVQMVLMGDEGAVAGSGEWRSEESYLWTPAEPLEQGSYTAFLLACDGVGETSTTLRTWPRVDPASLVDTVFIADAVDAVHLDVPDYHDLYWQLGPWETDLPLEDLFGARRSPMLQVGPQGGSETDWTARIAMPAPEDVVPSLDQEVCQPTVDVPMHLHNPDFTVGPFTWPAARHDVVAGPLQDVVLTGLLTESPSGRLRVRSLKLEAGMPVHDDVPCGAGSLQCSPCAGGTCLDLVLDRMTMSSEPLAPPVESRTADDIANDPACAL